MKGDEQTSSSSAPEIMHQLSVSDSSSDDFWFLPEMHLQRSISAEAELFCDLNEQDSPANSKLENSPQQETQYQRSSERHSGLRDLQQLKRTRSTEVHNISERRRRDRIKWKVRALQDLMPHCKKTDRASILEDAVEYIKSLKLQVETMKAVTGGDGPAQCMSYVGRPSIHCPSIPTMEPVRPGVGMGIGMMPYGAGVVRVGCSAPYDPFFQLPSPRLAFFPTPVIGFTPPAMPTDS